MRRTAKKFNFGPKVGTVPGAVRMLVAGDEFLLSPKEAVALTNSIADALDELDRADG